LKILDPACGLGSFLVAAYEFLKGKMRSLDLKENEIHKILLNQILYGVDIEPTAAKITALALLLRRKAEPVKDLNIAQFDILNPEEEVSKNLKWF
jgi:type I restriction-modification system DNA methylase subunit